jgi:hypothetical protein
MNPRSSHTHCQVAQADTQTKTWQRVCLPHADKIELKKISSPSEHKKYSTAQPDTQARQKNTRQMTQTADIKMVVTHDRQEQQTNNERH